MNYLSLCTCTNSNCYGDVMAGTLKQIAEIANVSRGTVDRVLHGRYGVDPKTRARVLAVMQELDYKPNAMAQALRGLQNEFRIGAIVPSEANPFYRDINSGIDEASKMAATYGMEVIKLTMDCVTVENQLECIDKIEEMNVCGIMLVPIENQRIRERINRLPESVPVITFNSDISGTKRMCFVGNDHIMAGRTAGQLMSIVVRESGKIALLISQMDFLAHVERIHGFGKVLEEERGGEIEMIGPYMTYESEERAFSIVKDLIHREKNLVGIYMAGGGQQAAARALAQSGKAGKIHMICHDMLPETIHYLKERVVDFTIGQEAFMQGYMPVEIFRDYHMFGRKPKLSRLFTGIDIRSRENVSLKGYEVFTGMYSMSRR